MKMNKQNKAFTLVELMIVIAIIGVLAATLLPRLQGAQERSRDTGRVSSVSQIAAVLQTYFSDTSTYPISPSDASDIVSGTENGCLSAIDGSVNPSLGSLFTGGKAPLDPSRANISHPCETAGSYGYYAIEKNGVPKGGYVLTTNVESDQRANYNTTDTISASSKYEDIQTATKDIGASSAIGAASIYVQQS